MEFNSSYITGSQTFWSVVTFCTTYTTIALSVLPELKPLYINLDLLWSKRKLVFLSSTFTIPLCCWIFYYSFSPFHVLCEDQKFPLFWILEVSFDFLLLEGLKNLRHCSIREDTKEIEKTLAKIGNNHDVHHQPKFQKFSPLNVLVLVIINKLHTRTILSAHYAQTNLSTPNIICVF